ncbi:hypothetical protein DSL92_00680 [Billgrantia gudaonensis]|uniref:Uncharacterized protein n=1 Tax=Billgrantia gudaonensis TaxID=376427 RepID=A0A432JLZ2_9GAMM|nr:hypothetical protein DSL92_00680 [Halomonas gudaonensis]
MRATNASVCSSGSPPVILQRNEHDPLTVTSLSVDRLVAIGRRQTETPSPRRSQALRPLRRVTPLGALPLKIR